MLEWLLRHGDAEDHLLVLLLMLLRELALSLHLVVLLLDRDEAAVALRQLDHASHSAVVRPWPERRLLGDVYELLL